MFLRSLGPAVAHVSLREVLQAGGGVILALGLLELGLFLMFGGDGGRELFLVAPFGASAVMLFALPNSPLAQPWSVVVGNVVGALVGIAVARWLPVPLLVAPLAVALALTATLLARALHPPAGAVALYVALSPAIAEERGFWFALSPIAVGSVVLVLCAMGYARLTGRRYPFRKFGEEGPHRTSDSAPPLRMGLGEAELTAILERYRQSFNLGVKDLARLIGAAELQAAGQAGPVTTAAEIMSRDLVTLPPEAGREQAAALFRRHGFTSIPVTGPEALYLGVLFQIHLIETEPGRGPARVEDLMSRNCPTAAPDTPIAALLPLMAEGEVDAVPVLEGARITGIVTRTDLIAALARSLSRGG